MRRGDLVRWGLAALFVLVVAVLWWPGYVERSVSPDSIRPVGGHAYHVPSLDLATPAFFRVQSDTRDMPSASSLVLFEDGRALSTPHAPHEAIGREGSGAYSHWGDGLYLSSSDNSDPRRNGRRYTVRTSFVPRVRLFIALGAALLLGLFPQVRFLITQLVALAPPDPAQLAMQGLRREGQRLEAMQLHSLLATIRVAGIGVAVAVLVGIGYFALLDIQAALEFSRKAAIRLAMNGAWFSIGAVAALVVQRRDLKSWRLLVALVTLAATGFSLYLKEEIYGGNRFMPLVSSMTGPMAAGFLAAYAVRLGFIRRWHELFWMAPGAGRRALTATIIVALCLAAPMVLSPVIANWNTSGWMDSHIYDTYAHNIISGKVPEASSQYMPVYQYGMAAVYYVFGHFFFAQQLVNVGLAFLTVVLICLSAWNLFRNLWAVLLIGIWVALMRQFVYAVFFTQIESWYIPIVAFGIFAWTSYWRAPSTSHLLLLALAAGIGINTRNQGAFYFGWLCLAPLFIAALPWRKRFTHAAIAVAVLAATLVPWSVRNYVVDGRLSPSSSRNAYYVAILNDPRIGFYGVRYWEGWGEIVEDYGRRYPDPVERDRVMMRAGLSTPFNNFDWFKRAMYWRTLAFYGLLPPGVFATEGPAPTNWATEWRGWVYWRTTPLLLLPLSLFGLLTRPSRTTLFLAGAVVTNVMIVAMTGGAEDRVSYPVLPLHMLLALAAIFPLSDGSPGWSVRAAVLGVARTRTWLVGAACLVAFLVICRSVFGAPNLYAPQAERSVFVNPKVEVDQARQSLNEYAATTAPNPAPATPEMDGRPVRLRLMVWNYQCPPKFGGRIPYMPDFATDPNGATYYYASLLVRRGSNVEQIPIGVSWFGATVNETLREGDEVEAEGQLMLAPANPIASYWVRIEKARKLVVRSAEIPPFF